MRRLLPLLFLCTSACGVMHGADDVVEAKTGPIDGIVFVHGINSSGADWSVMVERFKAEGWPEDRLIAESFTDPSWGCNTLNAAQVADWVHTLEGRGAQRIAIVAHSMGGLSSRYFMKSLDGHERIAAFITLGTMHHGLTSPCLAPVGVCVWKELCSSGRFIRELNTTPTTPGPATWTSIFSDGDQTVPSTSSTLDGATNVLVPGLQHAGPSGLQDSEQVFQSVLESLRNVR
ncbi:MAG: hypothetical protein QM817_37385 [Archangium sp.]